MILDQRNNFARLLKLSGRHITNYKYYIRHEKKYNNVVNTNLNHFRTFSLVKVLVYERCNLRSEASDVTLGMEHFTHKQRKKKMDILIRRQDHISVAQILYTITIDNYS